MLRFTKAIDVDAIQSSLNSSIPTPPIPNPNIEPIPLPLHNLSTALIRQQFRKNPHNTLASYHEGTMRIHTRPQEIINVHPSWRSRLSQDTLSAQLHIRVWNCQRYFNVMSIDPLLVMEAVHSWRWDTVMWDVGAAGGMRYRTCVQGLD